jgi:SapC
VAQANTTADAGRTASLPIFYSRPRPLDAVADRGRSLRPVSDFGFARATNSVLLGAAESPRAVRSYPIVFTSREPRVAVAVLGLEGNENLFVGEDGRWREGHYVPAYVRRYPFISRATGNERAHPLRRRGFGAVDPIGRPAAVRGQRADGARPQCPQFLPRVPRPDASQCRLCRRAGEARAPRS